MARKQNRESAIAAGIITPKKGEAYGDPSPGPAWIDAPTLRLDRLAKRETSKQRPGRKSTES